MNFYDFYVPPNIASFTPKLALESPLGLKEDCGKRPSCMGEGGSCLPVLSSAQIRLGAVYNVYWVVY